MRLFNLDGPFQKYGTMVFDLIMINVIWLLISLFSFGTLSGVATMSMYATVNESVVKSEGYVLRTFFSRFKKRFLISFLVSLIGLVIILLSFFAIRLINSGALFPWLLPIYYALILYSVLIMPFVIALLAETKLGIKDVFKYGFLLAIKHLPYTILCLVTNIALLVVIYSTSLAGLIFAVAPAAALNAMIISGKILNRYQFAGQENEDDQTYKHDGEFVYFPEPKKNTDTNPTENE